MSKSASDRGAFSAVKATCDCSNLLFNNADICARGTSFEDLTYKQWLNVVR
jgi:hypothetical protein